MKSPTDRRRFLQLAAGASLAARTLFEDTALATEPGRAPAVATLGDERLTLEFDGQLRWRLTLRASTGARAARVVTGWTAPETLLLADGRRLSQFALRDHSVFAFESRNGRGRRLRITGIVDDSLEKSVEVDFYERYPGVAFMRVTYRALAGVTRLRGWTQAALQLSAGEPADPAAPPFWSYCGSTHEDRRDWVQPVRAGFFQENFMGMSASDYGGGTPIVDVWRRDLGVAVGHLEPRPQAISLPLRYAGGHAQLAMSGGSERTLSAGDSFATPETFIAVHSGDHFAVLETYRALMVERGLSPAPAPESAYEPIWCAWGYERACTSELIEGTLPKVEELGLRWAVIDDGWQSNVGDWRLSRDKYPHGESDLKQLLGQMRARHLRPRLWFAPLAAAPGSDVLHDHTDMLLLDKEGAPQAVSWWNSFYLCPAYEPTIAYTQALVRQFLGEWGFEGLKIDGQHLNGVAPCYNPAHRHARPEESSEKLQEFLRGLYETAMRINPAAVIELCPCGTAYTYYNFPSFNQAPASDPESSWQVRHKGKTLKALMGPAAAFAGDHVELSDGGDDFASTVGIGAVVSTKFTWPRDPKPKDSFLLTPEREQLWRRWLALYNQRQLPRGRYRGELYDIGFDRPEAHVIEKSGHLYYAFYGRGFQGAVTLRGLEARRYQVRDYFNNRELGEVSGAGNSVPVSFDRFLLLEAIPL
jgi:alpha-galactosidase